MNNTISSTIVVIIAVIVITIIIIGTMQRRLAWPVRKNDTRKSRSVTNV